MASLRPAIGRQIPAFCTSCGNIFNSERGFFRNPIIEIGGKHYEVLDTGTYIEGLEGTLGCPTCGNIANFRCDLFDVVDEMFQDLKRLGKPQIIYLKELLVKFNESNKGESDADELRKNSEKQGIMILGKFGRENVQELTLIATLLSIIVTIILFAISNSNTEPAQIDNSVTIENIYQLALKQAPPKVLNVTTKVIPRNQPCPCGSKKKFKHCCDKKNKK